MKKSYIYLILIIFFLGINGTVKGVPRETIKEINLGTALDETTTIKNEEYLVYKFLGNKGDIINVNIWVVNGNPINTFLMNSDYFSSFESMMLGGSAKDFSSIEEGSGKNIKEKLYRFTLPDTGKYYIIIDNTNRLGDQSQGNVDIRVKIDKYTIIQAPVSKETPKITGFEIIVGIFAMLFINRRYQKEQK